MSSPFPMMFHPTLVVEDLEEASAWFGRVFGRREVRWEEKWDISLLNASYPINYSYFFVLGDVSLDVLCPALLVLPGDRAAVYPSGEGLSDMAWFTSEIENVSSTLEANGFRTRDQEGTVIHDGDVPESNLVADCPMIWTLPEDTGLTYEFYTMAPRHWPKYSLRADPRLDPDWVPDQVVPGDPLGIVRCARHVVLTEERDRARRLFVDVLGGTVATEGYDVDLDADFVDIAYAKSLVRFATPRAAAIVDVLSGETTHADQYVGMTFDVVDVAAAQAHLTAQGLETTATSTGFVTVPASSKGVAWGFQAA